MSVVQGELFEDPRARRGGKGRPEAGGEGGRSLSADHRKLVRTLRAAEKGGLVNGMTRAAFARRYPRTLPPVTVPK